MRIIYVEGQKALVFISITYHHKFRFKITLLIGCNKIRNYIIVIVRIHMGQGTLFVCSQGSHLFKL